VRPIDSCITQLKAQGPSRTCNESKEKEEEALQKGDGATQREHKGDAAVEQIWHI